MVEPVAMLPPVDWGGHNSLPGQGPHQHALSKTTVDAEHRRV
jgi:hypothetical protein